MNERDLQLLIDTIPAMAWSVWPDGRTEFFSQHYRDFISFSAGQATEAASNDGHGAVFSFSIPCEQAIASVVVQTQQIA